MTDVVQDGTHIVNSNIVKVTISNNCKLITFFYSKKCKECFTINLFHFSRSRPTFNKHVCHSKQPKLAIQAFTFEISCDLHLILTHQSSDLAEWASTQKESKSYFQAQKIVIMTCPSIARCVSYSYFRIKIFQTFQIVTFFLL